MEIASLPAVIMGSIVALVGVVHGLVWLRGAAPRHHLVFALTCLCVAAYDGFSAALYSADSVAAGAAWQRWQTLAILLGGIGIVWFVHDYADQENPRMPRALSVGFLVLVVLWFVGPREWFWTDLPDVKVLHLPFGGVVDFREVEAGPLFLVEGALGALTFVYVIASARWLLRIGRRQQGRRLLIGAGIFFAGVANDIAITSQIYTSVYLIEVSFLALVLLVSQDLVESTITSHRIAETLKAAEQAYRDILDSVQDAVFIHDGDSGRILDINAAATRLFGLSQEGARKTSISQMTVLEPDAGRSGASENIRLALAGEPQLFEWHARHEDGSTFWVEVSLRAAEIGGEKRLISVVRDISARKAAEEALRQSRRELTETNNMLQMVLDTIPVRVFWKSRALTYLGCNRLFAKDAGLEAPDEIVGMDDRDLPWSPEADLYRQDDIGVLTSERPRIGYEEPQTTPQGQRIWLHTSKLPLRDADGRVIGVLGIYEDITERRAEQEALRRSEENLTITLNSIGDGVIATDADGRVVRMNPVAEQLTGWAVAEARGQPLGEVFRLTSDATGEDLPDLTARILAAGGPVALESNAVLLARDGTRRLIADSGAPIRDQLGRTAGVVLVFRDVTEEYALQEQLRQAQKMEAIGRLAGGVAHDFNNLLQAIEGYRALAAASRDNPQEVAACLDDIGCATERAAALTRQLLAFSRQDSAQVRSLDIGTVIEGMTRMLDGLLGSDIVLKVTVTDDATLVEADTNHIEQILLNLALNARDAMPSGGYLAIDAARLPAGDPALPAALRRRAESFVALAVSDTGAGIPPEIRHRIFEPFFTTKEVGAGTGLGLSTVYAIVERLRGALDLKSILGKGSTFTVYLPIASAPVPSPELPVAPPDPPPEDTGGATLLLAEDDAQVRALTARILRGAGYTVHVAKDGEEAIAIFRREMETIKLVVADVIMPRRSGLEVLAAVNQLRPTVPVLFTTGYGGEAPQRLAAGVPQAVIAKPYEPAELLKEIRRLLHPKAAT